MYTYMTTDNTVWNYYNLSTNRINFIFSGFDDTLISIYNKISYIFLIETFKFYFNTNFLSFYL